MKHKDPNGEWCEGEKDPQHPNCWHCDTCPFAECVENVLRRINNMPKPICSLFGCMRERAGQKLASCPRCWVQLKDQKEGIVPLFFWQIWTWIKIVALAPVALVCLLIVAVKEKKEYN